jgi:hypothetical protein
MGNIAYIYTCKNCAKNEKPAIKKIKNADK